ncbi:mucin-19-like isoform X2 [Acanthaster planci]|uniref:Mucin-19-like isoform X2 n=1 Tax=Acanthaster planci TaxID=133434 RepID=A0A8B8A300_ACAPL|nr:mucin-19-like isoform X2 [Acanthaster planci]
MEWERRRLLALCGILLTLCFMYIFKFSVLSSLFICIILGVSMLVLNIASKANIGAQRNRPIHDKPDKSRVKGHQWTASGNDTTMTTASASHASEHFKIRKRVLPVSPTQRTNSTLKETEFVQKSGLSGRDLESFGPVLKLKGNHDFVPMSPDELKTSKTWTPLMTTASGLISPVFSSVNKDANLTTSLLPSTKSPLISPVMPVQQVENAILKSSPQRVRPSSRAPLQSDHSSKAIMFPLPSRHYPTHQPDYAQTKMGILPASSIFFRDGLAGSSLSPHRKGGGVRMHSPVTVKIARPDNRRSASPLFRRLSAERSSGSPLHRDTIIAALQERRKRLAVEEQDDSSSVGSSVAGGVFAKRRRLDDGSQCSTPSLASSSNYSTLVNSDAQSDSSAEEQARVRFKTAWTGARGVQSRTPRNAIDSSVSSSRRAAIANQMMRKRVLLLPAQPESSPSKKTLLPHDADQMADGADKAYQPADVETMNGTQIVNRIGESDSVAGEASSKDGRSSSDEGTPTKASGKSLTATRLKTPKLRSLGRQMLRNSSPPGEYTAADLEEDRHRAKQRVNYILESLKDGEDEEVKNLPREPSTSVGLVVPQTPQVSSEPTSTAPTLSSDKLFQLSKMNTLPVAAVQAGQLLLPSTKTDTGSAGKEQQVPAQRSNAPAVTTQQQTGVTLHKGVTFGTPLTQSLSASPAQAAPAATSSSVLGFTVVDSSKTLGSSGAPQKDAILRGILVGPNQVTTASSVGFGLGAVTSTATSSPATLGKQGDTGQPGLGQAAPKKTLEGLLSQGTPVGGLSAGSVASQLRPSEGSLAQASAVTASQQASTTSSSPFSQTTAGSSLGATTAAPSKAPSMATVRAASSGFRFGAPVVAATSSGPAFGSTLQGALTASRAPSTFQFGAPTQITQSSAGFQVPSATQAAVTTTNASGTQFGTTSLKTEAQASTPFAFGATPSTTAKTTAPVLSFGGAANSIGQVGATSIAASGGLFNPTSAASGGVFGVASTAAATNPSFTPAFGQTASTQPSSTPAFNFSAQSTQSSSMAPTGGFQFKPAFGAPAGTKPTQSQQQQPGKPAFLFSSSSSMTGQPAGAAVPTGSFTFNSRPAATTSSSVFGAGATVAASPFQTATSGATGGIFGQQPTTQTPSFGTATAQPMNTFGGPTPRQNVFGGQSTVPAPGTVGFNFVTPAASQTNQPSFNFGAAGGFGTPAPSAAPSFGGVTPANSGGFTLGSTGSAGNQRRISRLSRQARQNRRR